jgi:hypothetical protein
MQSKNEDTSPETPADLEARFLRAVVPFQHMTYAEQLELKQKKMGDLMRHDVENPICKGEFHDQGDNVKKEYY